MFLYPIIVAHLALMCFGLIDNGRGAAYPQILEHFGVEASLGAMIFTLSSVLNLITNYFSKSWLPYFGTKKSMQVGLFLHFLCSFLYALTVHFNLSFSFMLIASVFLGIAMGICNVCMNLIVAKTTPIEQRSKVFSGLHSVYAISSLLSPLIFGAIIKYFDYWPLFFYLLSLPPLLTYISTFFNSMDVDSEEKTQTQIDAQESFFTRTRIGMMLALYVSSEVLISSRLVYYLQKSQGFKPENASAMLSLFFLALLVGRLIPAFINLPGRPLQLLKVSALSSLVIILLGLYHGPYWLSLSGLSMAIFYPTTMNWISRVFPQNNGIMMASALNYVGLILIIMHIGFGLVAQRWGVHQAMHLSCIYLAISFILILSLKKFSTLKDPPSPAQLSEH